MADKRSALVVGVTGIVGLNLAKRLLSENWCVYGISRRRPDYLPDDIHHMPLDLTNALACKSQLAALKEVDNLYVFYTTWINMGKEVDNCDANRKMIANLIDNITSSILHIVLVTGTKHYMGSYDKSVPSKWATPFKESLPRLPYPNFYYDQEDVVFDRATKRGFTWTVARPHTIIGFAPYNQMNLGASLAVYATLCKYLEKPFIFPGGHDSFDIFRDATDTDLLAEHLIWETTDPRCQNQAFNVVNGDIIRWRYLWQAVANYFHLQVQEPSQEPIKMVDVMKDMGPVWNEIVDKFGLHKLKITELASWWLVDFHFSRSVSSITDMSKSREMGFLFYKNTEKSFYKLFDYLRLNRYIP